MSEKARKHKNHDNLSLSLSDISPDSSSKKRKTEEHDDESNSCHSSGSSGDIQESRTCECQTHSISRSEDIPTETSRWSIEVLSMLKVKMERENSCKHVFKLPLPDSFSPMTVFEKWLDNLLRPRQHGSALDLEIDYLRFLTYFKKIKCHMSAYPLLNRLDFDSIHDIKQENKNVFDHVETDLMVSANDLGSKIPALKDMDPVERTWRRRFIGSVEDFTATLKCMLSFDDNISEAYYRQLFLDFIGMFGLRGLSAPCVPTQYMKVGNVNVSSVPDVLLYSCFGVPSADNPSKLLAVVEMKNKYEEPCNPTSERTRCDELFRRQKDKELSMNDEIIGHHVEDLLLHSHLSASSSGLIGMIVQGTHLTFTHLSCTSEHLNKIKSGNYQHLDESPKLTVSRSYNFLKHSDNKELMEPLLILGLLQVINRLM